MKRLFGKTKAHSDIDPFHVLDKKPERQHITSLKTKIITGQIARKFGASQPSKASLIVVALISGIFGGYFIYQSFAAVPTYYIDCSAGSDTANTGTSSSSPWRSLTKASTVPLGPGSQLLLKRGCTWTDILNAGWNGTSSAPIIIGAYGDGELPTVTSNVNGREMIAITGSYLTFENIFARGQAPKIDAACQNNPVGYIVGFSLKAGSSNNTIRNIKASGNYAGISIKEGSHHNRIVNNQLIDNTMMNPLDTATDNDAGAFGVAVFGDDNEISGNTINGQYACSYDYNGDGAAVEIYGGQRNYIHHNKASNNEAFTELGHIRSADNVYAYNQVVSNITTSSFLITRGGTDNRYGPINGTKAYNNTVYFTGSSSNGIICHGGCSSTILSAKNNILWAGGKSLYADASFDEGNNIFWKTGGSPVVQATISASSQKVDPKFVSTANLDLHLQSGSPAIDKGINLGYATDLDSNAVPSGVAPDVGAYEFGSTTTPTTDTPPSPAVLSASPGDRQAFLTWNPATDDKGISKYEVWHDTTHVTTLSVTATSYTVNNLTNNTTYNFRVVAYDGVNPAVNSNIVSVAPAAGSVTSTSCSAGFAPFPSRLKAVGRNLVDENGCVMPKLKGFNIHAATSPGSTWAWEDTHFKDISANGGRVLRTVIKWDAYEATQGYINENNLSALDKHIARAQRNGLYVILELHLNVGAVPSWATSGNDETEKYAIYGQKITQTLAQRYSVARSADGLTINPKTVLGFNLNEPPQDGTTINGNNSIPTFEAQQRQMIDWFRKGGAPDWIGFVTLAYANQKPYLASPKVSANPDAYDAVGGNVVFDAHDYLVYNDSTDSNTDSRQSNGVLADTRYFNPGAHWLSILDPHHFPSDTTQAAKARSQMKAFLKPFDTYAMAAQMPLMVGEFGWNGDRTGGTGKSGYYAAKRDAMNCMNTAIETHWIYATSYTQDQWSAKSSSTTWDPEVLAWLKDTANTCSSSTTDTTPPTVSFKTPPNNTTVSGIITSEATAYDPPSTTNGTGISKVEFYVDNTTASGTPRLSDPTAPYDYSLDTKTLSNGSHTITAKAYDATGNSSLSTLTINAQNSDITAPSAPTNLRLNGTPTATSVPLAWNAATDNVGVVKYNILRNGTVIAQVGSSTISYTDTTAIASTSYTYTVQAVDAAGNTSANSAGLAVTTPAAPDTTPPSAPANPTAIAISSSQINLSWTASTDSGGSGLAGYNVYREKENTGLPTKINSSLVTTTSFGDTGLEPNTSYYYQVEAVDGAGNATRSVIVSTMTQPLTQLAALGLYTGPAGVTAHDSFSAWLGRDAIYAVDFADDSQPWENIASYSDWLMDPWANWIKAKPDRRLAVSLPMLNQASSGKLAEGARGDYDQYFRTFAQELTSKGLNNTIIRLGWEANGSWYPWRADPDPTTTADTEAWKSYYRRIVGVMRSVPGQNFKFDLSYNLGTSGTPITFENMYPGDDVVDIIGLDSYDIKWMDNTSSPDVRWNHLLNQPMGLNEFKAFAQAHNKPMSVPEWGLWPTGTQDGGGGDNPYYIDRMAEWFKANQSSLAYQAYFNHLSGGGDGDHRLSTYPNSQARYKAQFTGAPTDTPPAPAVLSATPGDRQAHLSWTPATDDKGISKYEVWHGTTYVTTLSATATSYTVSNLTNATTYNFRVVAYDGVNPAVNSNIVSVTPNPSIDTPPTVSISSPLNNTTVAGTITVTATATDNVGVAGVQFKLDGVNVGTEDTIAPYNYSLNTLTLTNGSHTITAVARDSANQAASATVTINVQNTDITPPTAPTGLTATAASSSQIDLAWNAATDNVGVTKYNILRKGPNDASYLVIATVNAPTTRYSNISLIASSNYSYYVQAVDAAGKVSANSNLANATTLAAPDTTKPSAPTNLYAEAQSSSQIYIGWSASTDDVGVAGYNVYRGTSEANISTKVNSSLVLSTSLGDTNLNAGTTYYYQVEAVDGAGNTSLRAITVKATTLQNVNLEAESMARPSGAVIINDVTASESSAIRFYTNGTASGSIYLNYSVSKLSVRAKSAQACSGYPQMIVKVDGIQVYSAPVSSSGWAEHQITANIASGTHAISVGFANDYSLYAGNSGNLKCSRDLDVDKVSFHRY